MKSSPLSTFAIAGFISLAGLVDVAAADEMRTYCVPSGKEWIAHSFDVSEDINMDTDKFCQDLNNALDDKPNCDDDEFVVCHWDKETRYFRFAFYAPEDQKCSAEDVHEIWTAAGGNELLSTIDCNAPPPTE